MNYHENLQDLEVSNLYSKLDESPGPILVRIDVNVPVKDDGRISKDPYNLRLEYYSYAIDLYSEVAPVVVLAHQGRNDGKDKNFIDLRDHRTAMNNMMHNARVTYERYIRGEDYFNSRLNKQIESLERGDVLLLENVRSFGFETEFDAATCPYIPFFKKTGIVACINDGLPLWHRKQSSVMSLPHIAPTYIGLISANELEIQHKILHDSGDKAIIIGGKKPKFKAIPKLAERMDIYTSGLTGVLACELKGYDVGNKNKDIIQDLYTPDEMDIFRKVIGKYEIRTPVDFVVSINGDDKEVGVKELADKDYFINDIGPVTVDKYADEIKDSEYEWVIRGGPSGIFERGYDNGIKLIRKVLGKGFVAVGGDTIEELQDANLCKPIIATGGHVLLGGGAHLDGWAGHSYPSVDEIIRLQMTGR